MSATAILSASDKGQASNTKMTATASRTAGDVVYIDYSATGVKSDLTPADDILVHHAAVCTKDMSSGDVGLYQTEGTATINVPSATYTAGNILLFLDGAVSEGGAFAAGGLAGEAQTAFAVVKETEASAVTELLVELLGTPFTATT